MSWPPPGWAPRTADWATLAPGIRWLIRPPNGADLALVQAETSRIMAQFYAGRASLERVHLPTEMFGELGSLDQLAGLGVLVAAVLTAERVVDAWDGMVDAETGEDIPLTPERLAEALFLGPPEGGPPMYRTFMAWVDRPSLPIASELKRLRALAEWEHSGGLEHCNGCDVMNAACSRGGTDEGAPCPRLVNKPETEAGIAALAAARSAGVWKRAGMGGVISGLDHAACLEIVRAEVGDLVEPGAVVRCLRAIEAGALAGAAARAKEN